MQYKTCLMAGLAVVVFSGTAPGIARACTLPLPMTPAEVEARDLSVQADLWSRHDMVFAVTVSAVTAEGASSDGGSGPPRIPMPGQERIRVQLTPTVMVKGNQPLPAPYEIRNISVGCAPQGIQRAQVGQRYLIYGRPSQDWGRAGGIVEIDRLRDAETLVAVYQAAALAAVAP